MARRDADSAALTPAAGSWKGVRLPNGTIVRVPDGAIERYYSSGSAAGLAKGPAETPLIESARPANQPFGFWSVAIVLAHRGAALVRFPGQSSRERTTTL